MTRATRNDRLRPRQCIAWTIPVLLLFCVHAPRAVGQTQDLHVFASPGAWVDVAAPQHDAAAPADVSEGAWLMLFDRQINVTSTGDQQYQHFAVKVLNAAGVSDYSQVNIGVDPAYQSVDIHSLRVIRDDTVIDQRELARIVALPEETELRNRIYNGRYNINISLTDVRAGDVIDFAYTIHSRDELFPGHFAARLDLAWSSRVQRQRIRILSPLDRALEYRLSDGEAVAVPRTNGDVRELIMERTDAPAVMLDAETPGWHYPWTYLEISDLRDWADVARLVAPLYARRPEGSVQIGPIVEEIRATGGSMHDQALRALQFVQEEIRYTSIAIGRGSHEPADPDTVLGRRFGDCKDKSLLLAAILGALGIEAQPALVHTWRGRVLTEALPTPYVFNHVIVQARIGNDVYWLDATAPTRYSPLSSEDSASFGHALLLHASGDLVPIPRPAPHTRAREVAMVFDLRDGVEAPASLDMTTLYLGTLADEMRAALSHGSTEQLQSSYANHIARYYPGATPAAPMTIDDDRNENLIRIRERYALESAFTRDENGVLTFIAHADELYPYTEPLGASLRRAPLAIEYPIGLRQHILVHLPEPWTVEGESITIVNPAFRYRGDVGYAQNTLRLSYEYEALADHVPLPALAQYRMDRSRVYQDLGYVLTYDDGAFGGLNAVAPMPFLAILLMVGFGIWIAIRWGYRYDPEPGHARPDAPVGIGGWLLLPTIGVVIGPFLWAWVLVAWAPFIDAAAWHGLPDIVDAAYSASAQSAVLGVIGVGALLLIGSVLAAVLFFGKRTAAPVFVIAVSWFGVLYGVCVVLWGVSSGLDQETDMRGLASETVRDVIVTLIWTAYLLSSARVKATFVNRLRDDGPEVAGEIAAAR